ncbi:hypothetical protein NP493_192g03122 [Ridgeia piscesae]|uniref:Secreted protein n=1 Tax=Ridgeia piscesae TaxID=27915 RepID=A0AAD9UET7_RIDPI|nr:hypothetical protein NP493_192g03122 [Ridgeia piscesae]
MSSLGTLGWFLYCATLVRFTPPREVTPPRLRQSDYQSYQKLTFTPPADLNDDVDFPSPPPSIAPPTESVRKVMLRQS